MSHGNDFHRRVLPKFKLFHDFIRNHYTKLLPDPLNPKHHRSILAPFILRRLAKA